MLSIIMKKIVLFLGIFVFAGFLALTDGSKAEASMQIGIMEDTLEEYEPAIEAFQKEYPEIPCTIQSIPTEGSTEEELLAETEQGKEIDLFLLNAENPVITDIIKWAMDGKLQDMEEILGEKMENLPLHPAAKEAGVFDGKRYFVPLGMTLTGVLTT